MSDGQLATIRKMICVNCLAVFPYDERWFTNEVRCEKCNGDLCGGDCCQPEIARVAREAAGEAATK